MRQIALFDKYIASRLESLEWRHFGVGALQDYLFESDSYEQRIHIWHPDLVAEGIVGAGDMHNHRFSFTSKVLRGELHNQEYKINEGQYPVGQNAWGTEGHGDLYEVINAREQKKSTGLYDGSVNFVKHVDVGPYGCETTYKAGDEYEFGRGRFHRTSFEGLTITLVTKFDTLPGMRAQIIVPRGATLIHAFDESRKVDIPGIIEQAKYALTVLTR